MLRRIIHISDQHGVRLLREHPFSTQVTSTNTPREAVRSSELQRAELELQKATKEENKIDVNRRYIDLKDEQKLAFN